MASVSKLVAQPEIVESIAQRARPWYCSLLACFFLKTSAAVVAEPAAVVAEPVAAAREPAVAEPAVAAREPAVAEPAVDPEDNLYISSSE
jgi:hypothetical protein